MWSPELAETEVERLRALLHEDPDRWLWAIVILVMIRKGWNPPPPTDEVLDRILADMGRSDVQADWATAMGDGVSKAGVRQSLDRDKRVPANATLYLTERERQVLALLSTGMTRPQVAENLGVSPETVKTHTRKIRGKLGATTNTQAVAMAIRSGVIR